MFMMNFIRPHLLLSPENDGGGGGSSTPAVDRGDVVSPLSTVKDPATGGNAGEGDSLDPDGDGTGEETAEEKAAREATELAEKNKPKIRVPKERLDEEVAKGKRREAELQAEIQRLNGAKQQVKVDEEVSKMQTALDELEDKYEEAIQDGKKEEAKALRRKVNAVREELSDFKATLRADAVRRSTVEEMNYAATLKDLERQYPAIDSKSDKFDDEKVGEIFELTKGLIATGTKRADALTKAVRYVLGAAPETNPLSDAAKKLAEARAEAARKKAAEANGKQPPSMSNVGKASDKGGGGQQGSIDVMKMSQKEFSKLDEDTLKRLRGDEVT